MKNRKTRIGIFVVFVLQCRVECPSVAFFIVYLCPSGKYSIDTIEKLTFSYTFLYCEKQFRYLILVCMFPIAGACAGFSCRLEIRRVALMPFLYSVVLSPHISAQSPLARSLKVMHFECEVSVWRQTNACWG